MRQFRLLWLLSAILVIAACSTYRVQKSETANIPLDSLVSIAPNAKIEKMIQPYREKVNADMGEVLCQSSEALYGVVLANYCADLTLEESGRICAEKYPKVKPDLAMLNRGGFRIPLPKGTIKTMTIFELMPFENEIVFLKLPGQLLMQFVDHMAGRGGEGIGGLRFGIKDGKAVQAEVNGKAIDPVGNYWLVTSDYVANSGDASAILSKSTDRIETGIKVRDLFIQYFKRLGKEGKIVTAKTDGRIYDAK